MEHCETLQEAARLLDIPLSTLNGLRRAGKITTKKSGRIHLVDLDELQEQVKQAHYEPGKTRPRKKTHPLESEIEHGFNETTHPLERTMRLLDRE